MVPYGTRILTEPTSIAMLDTHHKEADTIPSTTAAPASHWRGAFKHRLQLPGSILSAQTLGKRSGFQEATRHAVESPTMPENRTLRRSTAICHSATPTKSTTPFLGARTECFPHTAPAGARDARPPTTSRACSRPGRTSRTAAIVACRLHSSRQTCRKTSQNMPF